MTGSLELVTCLEQATFSLRERCTTDCATLACICPVIIAVNIINVKFFYKDCTMSKSVV